MSAKSRGIVAGRQACGTRSRHEEVVSAADAGSVAPIRQLPKVFLKTSIPFSGLREGQIERLSSQLDGHPDDIGIWISTPPFINLSANQRAGLLDVQERFATRFCVAQVPGSLMNWGNDGSDERVVEIVQALGQLQSKGMGIAFDTISGQAGTSADFMSLIVSQLRAQPQVGPVGGTIIYEAHASNPVLPRPDAWMCRVGWWCKQIVQAGRNDLDFVDQLRIYLSMADMKGRLILNFDEFEIGGPDPLALSNLGFLFAYQGSKILSNAQFATFGRQLNAESWIC